MTVAGRLREMGLELPPPFSAGNCVSAGSAGDLVFVSGSGPQLPEGGFVNSAPGFNQQPAVIDGASKLLISLFGDRGRHARSAVGMAELPFNIAVEVEMVVQVA